MDSKKQKLALVLLLALLALGDFGATILGMSSAPLTAANCGTSNNTCKFIAFDKAVSQSTLLINNPPTITSFSFLSPAFLAGDMIIVFSNTAGTTLSVTDNLGDAYTRILVVENTLLDIYNESSIWTTQLGPSSSPSNITISWNHPNQATFIIQGYRNVERIGNIGDFGNGPLGNPTNLFNITDNQIGTSSWFVGSLTVTNSCSQQNAPVTSNILIRTTVYNCAQSEDMEFNMADSNNVKAFQLDRGALAPFFFSENMPAGQASNYSIFILELVGYGGTSQIGILNNMPSATIELFNTTAFRQLITIPPFDTSTSITLGLTVTCLTPSKSAGANLQLQWSVFNPATGANSTGWTNIGTAIFIDNSAGNPCPGILVNIAGQVPAGNQGKIWIIRVVSANGGGQGDDPLIALVETNLVYHQFQIPSCLPTSITATSFKTQCAIGIESLSSATFSVNYIATNRTVTQGATVSNAITITAGTLTGLSSTITFTTAFTNTPTVLVNPTPDLLNQLNVAFPLAYQIMFTV